MKVDKTISDIKELQYLKGVVTSISGVHNTLDVDFGLEIGEVVNIPIAYFCQDTDPADLVSYSYKAFIINDDIIAEWNEVIGAPDANSLRVIGFSDGFPRPCKFDLVSMYYENILIFYNSTVGKCYIPRSWDSTKLITTWDDGDPNGENKTWIIFQVKSGQMEEFIGAIFGGPLFPSTKSTALEELATEVDDPEIEINRKSMDMVRLGCLDVPAYTDAAHPEVTLAQLPCGVPYWHWHLYPHLFCPADIYREIRGLLYSSFTQVGVTDPGDIVINNFERHYTLMFNGIDLVSADWLSVRNMKSIHNGAGTSHLEGVGAQTNRCIRRAADIWYQGDHGYQDWAGTTGAEGPTIDSGSLFVGYGPHGGYLSWGGATFIAHDAAYAILGGVTYTAYSNEFSSMSAHTIPFCGDPGEVGTITPPSWCNVTQKSKIANPYPEGYFPKVFEHTPYTNGNIGYMEGENIMQDWNADEDAGIIGGANSFTYSDSVTVVPHIQGDIVESQLVVYPKWKKSGFRYGINKTRIIDFLGKGSQTHKIKKIVPHSPLIPAELHIDYIDRIIDGDFKHIIYPGDGTPYQYKKYSKCSQLVSAGEYYAGGSYSGPIEDHTMPSPSQGSYEQDEHWFRYSGTRLSMFMYSWESIIFVFELQEVFNSGWIENKLEYEKYVHEQSYKMYIHTANKPPEIPSAQPSWAENLCVHNYTATGINEFFQKIKPLYSQEDFNPGIHVFMGKHLNVTLHASVL